MVDSLSFPLTGDNDPLKHGSWTERKNVLAINEYQ